MAKILYDNKFLLTRKLHKQYCKTGYRKTRKRIRVTCIVLTVLFALVAILLGVFTNLKILVGIAGFLAGYFFLMIFMGYTFSEWVNFGKMRDEYSHGKGLDVVVVVSFEPVNVHVKFGKSQFSFKYTSIGKADETEDLIILYLNHPGMIEHAQILYKNGFTNKGEDTISEFKAFINEKSGKQVFE